MLSNAQFIKRLINLLLGLVEIALGLRFILKLLGANPLADFVAWVYETTDPLLQPFIGMFPTPVTEEGLILEFSTLFAMVIYAALAWIIVEIIDLIARSAGQTKQSKKE